MGTPKPACAIVTAVFALPCFLRLMAPLTPIGALEEKKPKEKKPEEKK